MAVYSDNYNIFCVISQIIFIIKNIRHKIKKSIDTELKKVYNIYVVFFAKILLFELSAVIAALF